ncbi:MAG TPA: hypothetical protein VGK90_02110 [Rhizomicrobium sp.]
MTNEVEKNETAAESSHVANQMRQIAFAKVMAEVHRESDIGKRERVAPCIGLKDWNRCSDTGVRIDVHANDLDSQSAPDLFQDEACGTSYVQYPAHGQGIPTYGADYQVGVAEPPMDSGNVPVCTFD